MDTRWLQDFLTVAEIGNFTRSAYERHTSQTAFSRRIQALEAWLGVTLIDRSVFPTRLTPEGERFREDAAEILERLLAAKAGVGTPATQRRDKVRIASPHALALGRLPSWWKDWSQQRRLTCHVVPGNVHDTVTALVSGECDLLLCFHHAQQPVHLDGERFERVLIGTERIQPYVARACHEQWQAGPAHVPGIPLLMYSAGTYLGRMVELICQTAEQPLAAEVVFESDMADLLANMAAQGQGMAWLPHCAAAALGERLVAVDDDRWSMTVSLAAYRDRSNQSPALARLWEGINAHTR